LLVFGRRRISLTCYYYRGAYYKAFWADPPACTVGEPRKTYLGERSFPLIMQNVHRYFLYLALIFIVILTIDVWKALGLSIRTEFWDRRWHDCLASMCLLSGYTFGCHSLAALGGGFLDQFPNRHMLSRLRLCELFQSRHMLWAWLSLFWVGFSDLYVRLCSMGIWHDWRIV
jgi:hypothetical protein